MHSHREIDNRIALTLLLDIDRKWVDLLSLVALVSGRGLASVGSLLLLVPWPPPLRHAFFHQGWITDLSFILLLFVNKLVSSACLLDITSSPWCQYYVSSECLMHLQAHKVCMHHCTDGENSQGQSSLSLEKNDAHGAIGASLDVGEYVSAYLDDYMWCDVL